MTTRLLAGALAALLCAGCAMPMPEVTRLGAETSLTGRYALAPPGADPSLCYGRDVSPAVFETRTHRVMLQPAQVGADGRVRQPAVFKTETQRRIVRERREIWFETPCPPVLTEEFVGTLQRALKARALYAGPITGRMDDPTLRAVRAYQSERGLDSAVLSMRAARQMGLVTTQLDAQGAPDTDAPLLPPEED